MNTKPDLTPYDTLEQSAERTGFKPVIPLEYADRKASDEEQFLAEASRAPKPVACIITDQEIGRWYTEGMSPGEYNQRILEKLKFNGAPIEGTLRLRCAHGKVARVKSEEPKPYIQYLWLPELHIRAIAGAGRN